MSAGVSPAFAQGIVSTRSVPRFKLTVPLALTVLRAGIPNQIPGRSIEMGEGGIGVRPASQLLVGESVRVEFLVPHMNSAVRATAVVRYHHEGCFGLQFLRLPVEQQSMVRYWTRCQGELLLSAMSLDTPANSGILERAADKPLLRSDTDDSPPRFRVGRILRFVIPIAVIAAVLGWWRWEQGWSELESQLPAKETQEQPQVRVPADIMGGRIVYQVLPEYPEPARQAGVQGTVVLDTVVNTKGAVTQVKFISGPEALSQSAIDAVRWWRYQPYVANGQPATVETNVAVNFRLTN